MPADINASTGMTTHRRPVLGLLMVSAINIGCFGYIAWHFITETNPAGPTKTVPLDPISAPVGNISFDAVPGEVLMIASRVDPGSPDRVMTGNNTPSAGDPAGPPQMLATRTSPMEHEASDMVTPTKAPGTWVQLGALSKLETANSFWESLQKKHDQLLAELVPVVIGPDQAGGRLYHLRVGPLNADMSKSLCMRLKQAGTDCFCVTKEGVVVSQDRQAFPEPS